MNEMLIIVCFLVEKIDFICLQDCKGRVTELTNGWGLISLQVLVEGEVFCAIRSLFLFVIKETS